MEKRKVFQDSITPLPEEPGLTAHGLMINAAPPKDENQVLPVLFSLSIPDSALEELEQKVAAGETVPAADLKTKYMPQAASIDELVQWLKTEGFTITGISPNGTGVYATAPLSLIEKSLQVKMVSVTKEGVTYSAAQNAPSLPETIAGPVHAIIGLQPFRHANKHRKVPTQVAASTVPYTIGNIMKAYNADGLQLTGKGQTIAILIDTFPQDTDLTLFWAQNHVGGSLQHISKINVNGVTLPPVEGEETLDTEWASGIAPDADIRIYASGSLSFVDLDKALDNILSDAAGMPSLRQLSISLGLGETFMGGVSGEVTTQHLKYLRLAALGVNVFVSSGDAGSNPDASGHSPTGALQVEYSASDPSVIGVGGTSLFLQPDGTVQEETGWSAGGGGVSRFFKKPSWQKGHGVPTGAHRMVPDVSLTADPNEGALIILNGKPLKIGGTSWSAPAWAGFCALLNEARIKNGKPALPFLNPLIYPLIGTPAFRDITSGSNGAYRASKGYDRVTGIGVPHIANLIAALK